ncbi:MAG TPA: DapH/DapD/GlmU-related protein [Flavobacteriales bacterium]|nr:DapH/DapD/GlmU-related protein [Flavobacteriales bacterium]
MELYTSPVEVPLSAHVGPGFSSGLHCFIGEDVHIGANVTLGNMCVIESGAVIGDGVQMDHFCVVGAGSRIGTNTKIRSHVELRARTVVGNDCYIDSGVRSSGLNRIGDGVTLRYDAIIARGCDIGDGAYICPQVMTNNLDHNGQEVGGAAVGAGCFIGTNSTLAAGIRLAPKTVVGAKAMVTKDVDEAGVYIGVPAKRVRDL